MARWKLMTAHYLNTTRPAKWRYSEVSGGESIEKEYLVPRMLDPKDPKCWTNRAQVGMPISAGGSSDVEGEVCVCIPGRGQPMDIEFIGDPTPDMIPLDEEATAISETFASFWAYKPDTVDNSSFSQSVVDRSNVEAPPATVQVAGLESLVQAMEAQTRMIAELVSQR